MAKKLLVREQVERILAKHPHAKDNDNYLISIFWYHELTRMGVDVEQTSVIEFFIWMKKGKLASPESIRRSRQWLNEHKPETRGESYKARQERDPEVVAEISEPYDTHR